MLGVGSLIVRNCRKDLESTVHKLVDTVFQHCLETLMNVATTLPAPQELATKPRRIFQALRAELLQGEHAPGTRLSLRPLAKRFEVGINTVAAALRALENEGLVECEAGVGARVSIRDVASIRSDFILRLALETEAVRQCVANYNEGQARVLATLAKKVDGLAQEDDLEGEREADQRFHLALARMAEAPSLERTLALLLPRLVIIEHGETAIMMDRDISHRRIVQAIREGETSAVQTIRAHILDAQQWAIGNLMAKA